MLKTNEKQTVQNTFVGANDEQSAKKDKLIITNNMDPVKQNISVAERQTVAPPIQIISMETLFDNVYPAFEPLVEGILYKGTYLFVGSPKVGKTFFMEQLAYHVSRGIPLWGRKVNQGSALYLALEENEGRVQRRLAKMFDLEVSQHLYIATKAKTLATGLEHQMKYFMENYENPQLMIIDTLQRVRDFGGEKYNYSEDYNVITKLKDFADRYDICMIIVHHTRKEKAADMFENISGSNGLLGAADGAFLMEKRKRNSNEATLEIVGRDQPDQKIDLRFDREKCIWNFEKTDEEPWKEPPDPLLDKVESLFSEDTTEWKGSASELLSELQIPDMTANVLSRKLNVSINRLLNEYGIIYQNVHERTGSIITLKKKDVTQCDAVTINMGTGKGSEISSLSSSSSQEMEVSNEERTDQ